MQSRQYSTEQMKWFRKDKSYLWVRSELEKANPIANAMEKITHFYRADRMAFEAALYASHPVAYTVRTASHFLCWTELHSWRSACVYRDGGIACEEHRRVIGLNKKEAKAMRHYMPSAYALRSPEQDKDGSGAALLARLARQGEELRERLRIDRERGKLPPSAVLPDVRHPTV